MNNNIEENDDKKEEKSINLNNNLYKGTAEKNLRNMHALAELIDEKSKENIIRRLQKLTTSKKTKMSMSSFVINVEQIEQRTKNLLKLEPFFPEFNKLMDKKGEQIISEISCASNENFFEKNKIIYNYGDEADKFYIIIQGEVELFFPFTEEVDMNIDEFYIYILRLRRYGEIEMLNDVLLLNEEKFLKEIDSKFTVDNYIYKLYVSYVRLKFEPEYLYHEKYIENQSISNYYENIINFEETFDDREIKESILRISDELIETIKYIMPEKMYEIVKEKEDSISIKKLIKIPPKILNIYKKKDPLNLINNQYYYERILPKKILNDKLQSKKIIIMKYLKIGSLKKGQTFGDFNPDSFSLFSHYYLDKMKQSDLRIIKPHKHQNFRNMTVISSSSNTHLYSFGRTIFHEYFSKYIERKTNIKKLYILTHPLFSRTNNINLLKTYSRCFNEQILKEGEIIIKENEILKESNIFTYLIIKGECQLSCKKTIPQIDEIIKILGKEEEIKYTYNKKVKEILKTPQYDNLVKDPVQFKLNYLTINDIVGLTEYFDKDRYFLNVKCTQKGTKVYKVDSRIIKLFVDSDEIIKENKDIIIYDKYQRLCENLLKQRKMFFDSLMNEKKMNINFDIDYNPVQKKYKPFPQINTYKAVMPNYKNKIDNLYSISVKNIINNKSKLVNFNEDLDKILVGINHRFTLRDRKIDKSIELRQKLKEKMQKIMKKKIEMNKFIEQKEKNKRNEKEIAFDNNFGAFRKTKTLYRNIFRILPSLKTNPLNNFESKYELVLPYQYHKLKNSHSTSQINPLFYDDFNRSYNLSQYFNLKSDEKEKSEEKKKGGFEYTLKLSGIIGNNTKFFNKRNFHNNELNQRYKRINIRKFGSNPL